MPKVPRYRNFSREFKLKVIARLDAGEGGSDLARKLSIKRSLIYRWRDSFRRGGPLALRPKRGRPKKTEALTMAVQRGVNAKANDLSDAGHQIALLEAKIGRQQLEHRRETLPHLGDGRQRSLSLTSLYDRTITVVSTD